MKEKLEKIIGKAVVGGAAAEVFVPEHEGFGHYSTNVALRLAKTRGLKPLDLAKELAEKISRLAPAGFFDKVETAPPGFINFWISADAFQKEFGGIVKNVAAFGRNDAGGNKTVIVEYSQPNIAKKMHVGHLRTTIIGDALANILEFSGHKVVRWNYLGDWGTQFGKLIAAYKTWGDEKKVKTDPVSELQKLYVRFHEEAKTDQELDKRGQEEFKKLEDGDKENLKLWKWFRGESLKEFGKIYKILGVEFDTDIGESFYEKDVKSVVSRLFKNGTAKISEGAMVIPLDEFGLPPALIQKSDGASLYLTRDIVNLEYRLKKYKPVKILYVVGNEQSLHFEQLFAVAKVLGLGSVELVHVKYGLVLGEGSKKLATREGRTISLEEVVNKSIALAREVVEKKNPDLPFGEKEEIARAVGIGALKYNDLKESRTSDIVFDWERMLDFSGDSGPYLQYTCARLKSILRKADAQMSDVRCQMSELNREAELALIRKIMEFQDIVLRAAEDLQTSGLANYLYKLAAPANRLYETTPVLKEENEDRRAALLVLIETAAAVLKSGLGLLGIKAPEEI